MANPRDHIFLRKLEVNARVNKNRRVPISQTARVNTEHGERLDTSLNRVLQDFEASKNKSSLKLEPLLVFNAKVAGPISEERLRQSGVDLIDETKDKQFLLLSRDGAEKLKHNIQLYSEPVAEGRRPSHSWIADIEDLSTLRPIDRVGPKLLSDWPENIDREMPYILDIEFLPNGDREEFNKRLDALASLLREIGGQVMDHKFRHDLGMARITTSGQNIEKLLESEHIRFVDLPPTADTLITKLLRTSLSEIEANLLPPPDGAPRVCMIDSGVTTGHPVLRRAIGDAAAFPDSLNKASDGNGHGTMVAGILVYGDVRECIATSKFQPACMVFSARVLNDSNRFDDRSLIISQMEDAFSYYREKFDCRVFNVSLGDPNNIYDDGKPTPWAIVLDQLARHMNIVIVVSIGNFGVKGLSNSDAIDAYVTYPRYLLSDNKESRLIDPAMAANVLTVGALAHSNTLEYLVRHEKEQGFKPLASIDGPSPFTRHGPGINKAIKPDVCDYGGNVLLNSLFGRIESDAGLGIVSTHMNFMDGLFSHDIGTSFSAPKVANLAAQIFNRYPNSSANLVRALIANSADTPKTALKLIEDEDERLNLYGYGKPDFHRAVFSDDDRVTLIADETISFDYFHIYEIPIPRDFQLAGGKRFISIALAYDPPVRNGKRKYLGAKMFFRLFRGLEAQEIADKHAERPDSADIDSIDDQYKCLLKPGANRREAGTLQKATYEVTQNATFTKYAQKGDVLHLLVGCKSVWATQDEHGDQRYGLVISLRHINANLQLYNLIHHRVSIRDAVRERARVRS